MQILQAEFKRDDGILIQISTGLWKQVNLLEIPKGETLGGHYHLGKEELFYIIRGEIAVHIKRNKTDKNEDNFVIEKGNCVLIETGEEHTIIANKDSTVIELLSEPYDEGDSYKYE